MVPPPNQLQLRERPGSRLNLAWLNGKTVVRAIFNQAHALFTQTT
jgi:hypothetical protein